jgi:hypothetical protein
MERKLKNKIQILLIAAACGIPCLFLWLFLEAMNAPMP